ncbi:MAG: hypothetical protein AB8B52_09840 [Winogradskyella sp.]|uniref:hypothetical protein n=1 Tax=Winogradskyella sp. TaxID=1883156 RepID=UPI003859EADB
MADNQSWFNYIWFLLAAIYLAMYYQGNKAKYLSIDNGIIKENWLFGKSLVLEDIQVVNHFAGEYILKTDDKSLTIEISAIENDSLLKLHERLKQLEGEWKS